MALTDDLVSYWKLDETSGNRADSVGSNTLTDNNTVGSATGKIGNCADFDRSNVEYLYLTDIDELSYGDASYSFSGWVYTDASLNIYQTILSKEDADDTRQYRLECRPWAPTLDKIRWFVFTTTGSVSAEVNSAVLSTGWHFFVVYHNATANEIGISVDNATFITAGTSGTISTSTSRFRVGARWIAPNQKRDCYSGKIDEIGHWSRVLTQAEVTELYNNGSGITYPFPSTFTPYVMLI
jgi:hypothetical protein